jgi:acetyl esterase/lipase
MNHDTPMVPVAPARWRQRIVVTVVRVALTVSLWMTPRPAALLIRRVFAATGAEVARALERHVPADVVGVLDESYGDGTHALLDVYRPAGVEGPLPVAVWVHGGAWVGGSKEEISGYLKVLAAGGYAVVGLRYPLAPEHTYPEPVRHVMSALRHLQTASERLRLDPGRMVIAGDSAGAQITAQVAAIVTDPAYAEMVGVAPTITPTQLRGVILACGPYDLGALHGRTPTGRRLIDAVLWAYSGRRRFRDDPGFASASVAEHVGGAFPPALITVGNADPLRSQSDALAERLVARGCDVELLTFPAGHTPPLGHEYQFDLDSAAGRLALERFFGFLERRLTADR